MRTSCTSDVSFSFTRYVVNLMRFNILECLVYALPCSVVVQDLALCKILMFYPSDINMVYTSV